MPGWLWAREHTRRAAGSVLHTAHRKEKMLMLSVGWLVSFLVFLGIELAFGCLTSLWFAAGALGGFAAAFAGISMEGQLAVFVAVSFLTLILIRPAAFMLNRRERAGGHH